MAPLRKCLLTSCSLKEIFNTPTLDAWVKILWMSLTISFASSVDSVQIVNDLDIAPWEPEFAANFLVSTREVSNKHYHVI